jgi:hypothetical protein
VSTADTAEAGLCCGHPVGNARQAEDAVRIWARWLITALYGRGMVCQCRTTCLNGCSSGLTI